MRFRANISYTLPDFDEEDNEISDDEVSDNDMKDSEKVSSEVGASIESPPQKVSQAVQAIDLTRDESPASIVAVVDLTETAAEQELMDLMAGRPANIDRYVDPVSITIFAKDRPNFVENDDEDSQFSSDSDDQSDQVDYDDGSSSQKDSTDEVEDSGNGDSSDAELKGFQDKESERDSGLAGTCLFAHWNQLPQSNLKSISDASENMVEEDEGDDESDFGVSDAGAEGLRALFDDDELVGQSGEGELESPKHVTIASIPAEQVREMTSDRPQFVEFSIPSQTDETPSQNSVNARQPSPSDAAMVKTAAPSTTLLGQNLNPIIVHQLANQDFQKLTTQSLGEKTGKHAFFAAREDNRAKICAGENDRTRRASLDTPEALAISIAEKRQHATIAMERFRERKRRMEEDAKMIPAESAKVLPSRAVNISKLLKDAQAICLTPPATKSSTTLPYLNDHTQGPRAVHTHSPEPDMTSAVTYNESKASMASANKCKSVGRSGISISDIVDLSSGDQGTKNLKRKSDDISEAIENEIRVWATSSSAWKDSEGPMDITASASKATIRGEQSEIASGQAPETSQQRPAKRLRKIIESVGYVVLGGATLFGALVVSAPDFL